MRQWNVLRLVNHRAISNCDASEDVSEEGTLRNSDKGHIRCADSSPGEVSTCRRTSVWKINRQEHRSQSADDSPNPTRPCSIRSSFFIMCSVVLALFAFCNDAPRQVKKRARIHRRADDFGRFIKQRKLARATNETCLLSGSEKIDYSFGYFLCTDTARVSSCIGHR